MIFRRLRLTTRRAFSSMTLQSPNTVLSESRRKCGSPWLACLFGGWATLLSLISSTGAHAETHRPESAETGLDIILLVDVSGSMIAAYPTDPRLSRDDATKNYIGIASGKNGTRDGSDVQRYRWDAVKQLLDLLDADDRVLIRRFNDRSPAAQKSADNPTYYWGEPPRFSDGTEFTSPAEQDFPLTFADGGDKSLRRLAATLARFNTPADGNPSWTLDGGGTDIIHALASVAPQLTDQPVIGDRRPKRIILLTDGCDRHIDEFIPDDREEDPAWSKEASLDESWFDTAALKSRLSNAGMNGLFDAAGNPLVPVYAIGLNLRAAGVGPIGLAGKEAGLTSYPAFKARRFLRSIKQLTGGEFVEIETAGDLVKTYVKLIRELKGLWSNQSGINQDVNGRRINAGDEFKVTVSPGVVDFRSLAFIRDPQSAKLTTRPPLLAKSPAYWQGAPDNITLPPPQFRQGTPLDTAPHQGTLYSLWFGGALEPRGDSPFDFLDRRTAPAWTVRLSSAEHGLGEVTHFKRIPESFGWPPPKAARNSTGRSETRLFRYQHAQLTLAASRGVLSADEVHWTLRSRTPSGRFQFDPASFRVSPKASPTRQVHLAFPADRFVPAEWSPQLTRQTIDWELSGLGQDASRLLSGYSRSFSGAWDYIVVNQLPLKITAGSTAALPRIAITRRQLEFPIELHVGDELLNPVPDIPVILEFTAPRFVEGESLPADWFALYQWRGKERTPLKWTQVTRADATTVKVLLDQQGAAKLSLAWAPLEKVTLDRPLVAGRIVIRPDDETIPLPPVPSSIPVELNLERVPLRFYADVNTPRELNRLELEPTLDQADSTEFAIGHDLSSGVENLAGVGDSVTVRLERTTDPLQLVDSELQLWAALPSADFVRAKGTLSSGWTVPLPRDQRLRLRFRHKLDPLQARPLSKETTSTSSRLTVTGTGFQDATIDLTTKYHPPEVRFDLTSAQELILAGATTTLSFKAREIRTAPGPGLVLEFPETVQFFPDPDFVPNQRRENGPVPFEVASGLTERSLPGTGESETISIAITPPTSIPCGRYIAFVEPTTEIPVRFNPPAIRLQLTIDRFRGRISHVGNAAAATEIQIVSGTIPEGDVPLTPVRCYLGESQPTRVQVEIFTELGLPLTGAGAPALVTSPAQAAGGRWARDQVRPGPQIAVDERTLRWVVAIPHTDFASTTPYRYGQTISIGGKLTSRFAIGFTYLP